MIEIGPGEFCYRSSTCKAAMRLDTIADAFYVDVVCVNDRCWSDACLGRDRWL